MKGNCRMLQCGFSVQVVQILDELLPRYETVDVLTNSPEIRAGTMGGQFVAGCEARL